MDDRRFHELQECLNQEFGRRDTWHQAYHRFRRWIDEAKVRWNAANPLATQTG
jgi:hypothetical protein